MQTARPPEAAEPRADTGDYLAGAKVYPSSAWFLLVPVLMVLAVAALTGLLGGAAPVPSDVASARVLGAWPSSSPRCWWATSSCCASGWSAARA